MKATICAHHSQTKTLGTNQTTTETQNPRTVVHPSLVQRRNNAKTKPSETEHPQNNCSYKTNYEN